MNLDGSRTDSGVDCPRFARVVILPRYPQTVTRRSSIPSRHHPESVSTETSIRDTDRSPSRHQPRSFATPADVHRRHQPTSIRDTNRSPSATPTDVHPRHRPTSIRDAGRRPSRHQPTSIATPTRVRPRHRPTSANTRRQRFMRQKVRAKELESLRQRHSKRLGRKSVRRSSRSSSPQG